MGQVQWHSTLILCLLCQHAVGEMVLIPALPLLIQLLAYGLGKQRNIGPKTWAFRLTKETENRTSLALAVMASSNMCLCHPASL